MTAHIDIESGYCVEGIWNTLLAVNCTRTARSLIIKNSREKIAKAKVKRYDMTKGSFETFIYFIIQYEKHFNQ